MAESVRGFALSKWILRATFQGENQMKKTTPIQIHKAEGTGHEGITRFKINGVQEQVNHSTGLPSA